LSRKEQMPGLAAIGLGESYWLEDGRIEAPPAKEAPDEAAE
jgi:hypothetical protein